MKHRFATRGTDALLTLGVVMILGGVLLLFMGSPACMYLIAVGALQIYISRWQTKYAALAFKADHIVMKLAPLNPSRFILYQDIAKVESPSEKKTILTTTDGKKTTIRMDLFEPEHYQNIHDLLKKYTKEGVVL